MQNWFDRYRLRYAVLCNVRVTYVMVTCISTHQPYRHQQRSIWGGYYWLLLPGAYHCAVQKQTYTYIVAVWRLPFICLPRKMICCYWIHVKDNVLFYHTNLHICIIGTNSPYIWRCIYAFLDKYKPYIYSYIDMCVYVCKHTYLVSIHTFIYAFTFIYNSAWKIFIINWRRFVVFIEKVTF